jgi:hypothetical protein
MPVTNTITCTILSAAQTYTTTLPSGGVGVWEMTATFGDILIAAGLYLLTFSTIIVETVKRRRRWN